MLRILISTTLLCLVLLLPAATRADDEPTDPPWTLDECRRIALAQSPLIEAARHGIAELEAVYREAWWAWFPTFRVRTVATGLPPQGGDDNSAGPDLSEWNLWSKTDIEGYAPLYTFGKISSVRRMASHGVDAANAALRIARNELSYQVARAWYGLQLAHEIEDLIVDGEDQLRKSRERLERMDEEDDDEFDQADMFRLRIYEAEVHKLVLGNRRLQQLSRTGLRVALALPAGTELRLPEKMKLEPVALTLAPLAHYLDVAGRERPALVVERHRVAVAQANVDRRWADFWPDLFLAGSFTIAASTVESTEDENVFSGAVFNAIGGGGAIGIQLTLDYPQKIARYRRAQAEVGRREAEVRVREALLRVELEQAYLEAQDAAEILEYRRRSRRAARSLLVLRRQEYENGIDDATSFKDVLDASVLYLTQKSEWLKTVHAFNMSIAQLSRVVGVDVTTLQEPARP